MGSRGSQRIRGAQTGGRSRTGPARHSGKKTAAQPGRPPRLPDAAGAALLPGPAETRGRPWQRMRRAPRGPAVYIADNPAMPGLIKVGMTTVDTMERIASLSAATMVPVPFRLVHAVRVANPQEVEQWMHRRLAGYRVNRSREFFAVEPAIAINLLDRWAPNRMSAVLSVAGRGLRVGRAVVGAVSVAAWALVAIVIVDSAGVRLLTRAPVLASLAGGPTAGPRGRSANSLVRHYGRPPVPTPRP